MAVLPLLILVACGGGAPASTGPAAATPTQAQATSTGVPTVAPTNAPPSGSSNVEACSLLTPAEVAAAYGGALDLATPTSDELYSYCSYSGDGGEVRIFVTKSAETASAVFGTMKINDGEAVSGVGDEAFWSTDSFQPGLYFLKGGLLVFIEGSQSGPEDSIVELGKLLASRM
jgi:hypothetical protein